jgi:protein-disulfide isomerase
LITLSFILTGCGGYQASDPNYVLGNPNAKIQLVEFSDFECPACGKFHSDPYKELKQAYIDTGLIGYRFRDFPIPGHLNAYGASEAAYCAGEQGSYWDMHMLLFENQKTLDSESIRGLAEEIELDLEKFDACVNDDRYKDVINGNLADGVAKGVTGTPTLFVNDLKIVGVYPFATYKDVLDKLLAE